eukprot:1138481-Amphidinium_carterae.1
MWVDFCIQELTKDGIPRFPSYIGMRADADASAFRSSPARFAALVPLSLTGEHDDTARCPPVQKNKNSLRKKDPNILLASVATLAQAIHAHPGEKQAETTKRSKSSCAGMVRSTGCGCSLEEQPRSGACSRARTWGSSP